MLIVKEIEAGYGNIQVLKGLNAEVKKGEIVTLIGANGAGKTTL
ncbi:MAG: ATP-binding cassette domain-containing protein, partial [Deltaproteobacteria bacterium]|nr:ATP-binding cassette domain-containing protein [Deltaproteobacteria bacterium]